MSDKRIKGSGTPFIQWKESVCLRGVSLLEGDDLIDRFDRFVVVSPHPDDETLAFGGLLTKLRQSNKALLLVSVTNGEACYPGSVQWSRERLGSVRPRETKEALECLGWEEGSYDWIKTGFPDTAVMHHQSELQAGLGKFLRSGDGLFTVWREDGHSDHEAVGRACAAVSVSRRVPLFEAPVWALHWAKPCDERLPWERLRKLPLDEKQLELKHAALLSFSSQLVGDPDGHIAPILSASVLERASLPYEMVFI